MDYRSNDVNNVFGGGRNRWQRSTFLRYGDPVLFHAGAASQGWAHHLDDAASFAREQEVRPGVDQRDEILHKMERAESKEDAHAAAHAFLRWLEELDVLE